MMLNDKVAIVTGAARGIGREIALRFADAGASRVAVGYLRNDQAADAMAEELRARGAGMQSAASQGRRARRCRPWSARA